MSEFLAGLGGKVEERLLHIIHTTGGSIREHVQRLLDTGGAYRCFCTRERLDEVSKPSLHCGPPARPTWMDLAELASRNSPTNSPSAEPCPVAAYWPESDGGGVIQETVVANCLVII